MKASLLYRIACVILVLFAAGHTFGFLSFRPPTPEGLAVWNSMNHVHFQISGTDYSYAGFYIAFGLTISFAQLLEAYLSWFLGRMANTAPQAIAGLAWVFFLVQVAGLVLCCLYFGAIQIVFGSLVVACTGGGAWQVWRANRQKSAAAAYTAALASR
ncbi:MAG TPA: hypothetical protein VKU19_37950 [Bryobacteraceae bacterium]|nr:hypothetical protein [Bryobacteraceae bacterium]